MNKWLLLVGLLAVAGCKKDSKQAAPAAGSAGPGSGSAAAAPVPAETPPTPDAAEAPADAAVSAAVEPCTKILTKAMACKNEKGFKKSLGKKAGSLYEIGNAEAGTITHACVNWTAPPADQEFPTKGGLDWTKPTVADVATAAAGDCAAFGKKLVEVGGLPTEMAGND